MDPTAKWSARHPNRKPHPTRPQQSSDGLYVSRCISKKESQESLSLSLFLCAMYYTTPDFCVCVCLCLDRFLFSSYLLPHTFFFSSSSSFIAGRSSFFLPFLMSSKKLCRVPAGTERNDVSFLLLLLLFYFPVIFLFFSFCVSVSLFPFCFVFRIQR
jgi:hypothetical protein